MGHGDQSPAVTKCLGTIWTGKDHYIWIDLGAGPVEYGPALYGDGLMPRGEFHPLASIHGRPKSQKSMLSDLASLVWSAYQVLAVPSLRIPVPFEDSLIVQFIHINGSPENKDSTGLDWKSIEKTFVDEANDKGLLLGNQSLSFKKATTSYRVVKLPLDEGFGRVVPVYVFDLDVSMILLLDRYHQAVAFKDMVIASMWGVSPTHFLWGPKHNSTLVDDTWSVGNTPFVESIAAHGAERKLLKRNELLELVQRWNLFKYKLDKAVSALSHFDFEMALYYLRDGLHVFLTAIDSFFDKSLTALSSVQPDARCENWAASSIDAGHSKVVAPDPLPLSLVVDSPYPKISNSTEFQPTEEQSGGLTEEEAGFSQAQTPMIHRSEESLAIVECVDPIVAVYPEGRREDDKEFDPDPEPERVWYPDDGIEPDDHLQRWGSPKGLSAALIRNNDQGRIIFERGCVRGTSPPAPRRSLRLARRRRLPSPIRSDHSLESEDQWGSRDLDYYGACKGLQGIMVILKSALDIAGYLVLGLRVTPGAWKFFTQNFSWRDYFIEAMYTYTDVIRPSCRPPPHYITFFPL
ncbi:unnamed protein product [Cuscuta campestris]|uniref:DUF7906 domain-containing protein n=1 Tax=Cuscuta campestris TaxID=132261 RepID=A0A484M6P6_9ASTE|nr:unnamed protein product [Cuscuta campestris]